MDTKTKWNLINKQIFNLLSDEELSKLKSLLKPVSKPSSRKNNIINIDDSLIKK